LVDKTTKKILVVDDEKIVRDFLSRFLTLEDMQVRVADGGLQAIAMAKEEKFDIIFVDARMPQMDGLEALKELKKINPGCKYIMMTGYSLDDLLKKTGTEKIDAIIRKPFEINEIATILADVFQQKSPSEIKSVLFVGHEEPALVFFKKLLKNYNLVSVGSGQEALEQIGSGGFDAVFLDTSLSDKADTELCAKIREVKPNLEIILIMGDVVKKEGAVKGCLYKQIKRSIT
jgi:CheY-like chemotaxis protein